MKTTTGHDEYILRISNPSITDVYISTHSLCEILAEDPEYPLEYLFKRLCLYPKFASKVKKNNVETIEGRGGAWFHIIYRLTTGKDITGSSREYRPIKNSGLLPLYGFDEDSMTYLPFIKSSQMGNSEKVSPHLPWPKNREPSGYIKLEHIKKYFKNILCMPLPSMLFPEETSPKKLRRNEKDKTECQIIAKEVWKQYPILDIAHLINHPDILKITGKTHSQYKETTLRGWFSEIAPKEVKQRVGRRPKRTVKQQKDICAHIGIKL